MSVVRMPKLMHECALDLYGTEARPAGVRANTPNSLANGTFRGHIITEARAGKITDCAANIVTAGAAGSLGRFVIYRMDGKVLAQSADFDATTTGLNH